MNGVNWFWAGIIATLAVEAIFFGGLYLGAKVAGRDKPKG